MSPKAVLKLSLVTVCCSIFFLSNTKAETTFRKFLFLVITRIKI